MLVLAAAGRLASEVAAAVYPTVLHGSCNRSRLVQGRFGGAGERLHVGGCGQRHGEARQPGPCKVTSCNVTSLKGAWSKLLTTKADLLVVQEARAKSEELREWARVQGCQVVHGLEVGGVVLVAAFAWTGNLHKLSKDPDGTAHHFRWQVGNQHVVIRNGYMQGSTTADKDRLEQTLEAWLEEAAVSGEPTLILGDFNATKSELGVTKWLDLSGWHDLGEQSSCLLA